MSLSLYTEFLQSKDSFLILFSLLVLNNRPDLQHVMTTHKNNKARLMNASSVLPLAFNLILHFALVVEFEKPEFADEQLRT